jgi:hypothetical protein
MRLVARGLVVIVLVLSAGAFCAGAATQAPKLRVSANFDATGKIISQVPNGWIRATSYDATDGTLTIDFAEDLFSTTPNCTVNVNHSVSQPSRLFSDAFPQPVSTFSDGVVILDSIAPKRNGHSLPAAQVVCVGTR